MARPELIALLDDVKANPDDLTPWLVLTDWLEENGDEPDRARAEYCRLCFDKLGEKTYASDRENFERRWELFRDWKEAWLGPIAEEVADDLWLWQMRRGLVSIGMRTSRLLDLHARGLDEEQWQWVEELALVGIFPAEARQLASCPLLLGPSIIRWQVAWVRQIGPAVVKAMAKCPSLARVRELHVLGTVKRPRDEMYLDALFRPLRDRFGEALKLDIRE
jgi:uncharacterized protein (TIGR02996 family)